MTSWLVAVDAGWVWVTSWLCGTFSWQSLLALGFLLPLAVDAGWVWVDFVEFDDILPDFRLWPFFFLTQKSTSSGQVDFSTDFGGLAWLLGAQTDLWTFLLHLRSM